MLRQDSFFLFHSGCPLPSWVWRGTLGVIVFRLGGIALFRGTFAIVDERAISHNVAAIRSLLKPGTRLMVPVKANGYGHGALAVARTALSAGATDLGVATVEEAVELRKGGIAAPILVLGYVSPSAARAAAAWQIAVTLADDWSELNLPAFEPSLHIHIKVDTGMNRIGLKSVPDVLRVAKWAMRRPDVTLTGVFTHLACADAPDLAHAGGQMAQFDEVLEALEEAGIAVPIIHAANSAATLRVPDWRYDMVRVGISSYGYLPDPSLQLESPILLLPALNVYSSITRLETLHVGETVGYGANFTAKRTTRLATVPVGYADGYPRLLGNRAEVVIHHQRAPIVGNVCMDQLMVDVTDVEVCNVGDCVTLYGRYAPNHWNLRELDAIETKNKEDWLLHSFASTYSLIGAVVTPINEGITLESAHSGHPKNLAAILSLDELAAHAHTISYELMCALSNRIPRLYVKHYFDL